MIYSGFCDGSYTSLASTADSEDLINFYVSKMETQNGTTKAVLLPTPGVKVAARHSAGGVGRAHYAMNGREFAVIGVSFVEITRLGVVITYGTVTIDTNPATICGNGDSGNQLFITSGTNGYVFDLTTNTLTQIANLNGIATMGAFCDGFFLCLDSAHSRFYISNLLDGMTWSAAQFAHRNLAPDRWVSMKVVGRTIWLLGEFTSEPWYNQGTSPFPFAPYNAMVVQWGCAAPFSPAVAGQNMCWLSRTPDGGLSVATVSGFTPEVISNIPMAEAIGQYLTVDDAQGDSYSELGHTFYLITFVAQDVTWAYDLTSQTWAKRGTWHPETSEFVAWSPRWHVFAFGEHRMLDFQNEFVWTISSSFTLDVYGRSLRRVRRAPFLNLENKRLYFSSFELELDRGLADPVAPYDDPQVMMRFSNDYGKTWSSERMRSSGKIGKFGHRVRWNRCGMGRGRCFEISVTDAVQWRITNAYVEVSGMGQGQ